MPDTPNNLVAKQQQETTARMILEEEAREKAEQDKKEFEKWFKSKKIQFARINEMQLRKEEKKWDLKSESIAYQKVNFTNKKLSITNKELKITSIINFPFTKLLLFTEKLLVENKKNRDYLHQNNVKCKLLELTKYNPLMNFILTIFTRNNKNKEITKQIMELEAQNQTVMAAQVTNLAAQDNIFEQVIINLKNEDRFKHLLIIIDEKIKKHDAQKADIDKLFAKEAPKKMKELEEIKKDIAVLNSEMELLVSAATKLANEIKKTTFSIETYTNSKEIIVKEIQKLRAAATNYFSDLDISIKESQKSKWEVKIKEFLKSKVVAETKKTKLDSEIKELAVKLNPLLARKQEIVSYFSEPYKELQPIKEDINSLINDNKNYLQYKGLQWDPNQIKLEEIKPKSKNNIKNKENESKLLALAQKHYVKKLKSLENKNAENYQRELIKGNIKLLIRAQEEIKCQYFNKSNSTAVDIAQQANRYFEEKRTNTSNIVIPVCK